MTKQYKYLTKTGRPTKYIPEEAFLTSGEMYFDSLALEWYQNHAKEPVKEGMIYV